MSDVTVAQEAAVEAALDRLDLEAKVRLLSGQDMWTLPAIPEIGLASIVMSDGPVGVRGTKWSAEDPSVALPSPTALAATWDPELAREAGRCSARKPGARACTCCWRRRSTCTAARSAAVTSSATPRIPLLTGAIGAGYVAGVQDQGVATTVKHFVANDYEHQPDQPCQIVGDAGQIDDAIQA